MDVEYTQSRIRLDLGSNSRYTDTPLFEMEGDLALTTFERPWYKRDNTEKYFDVQAKYIGRLDLISQAIYGTVELWWLLAWANGIVDPFTEVIPGLRLVIPPIAETRNRGEEF